MSFNIELTSFKALTINAENLHRESIAMYSYNNCSLTPRLIYTYVWSIFLAFIIASDYYAAKQPTVRTISN